MKKSLLTFFLYLSAFPIFADVVTIGGINYELDFAEKTASVAKTNFNGDLVIPSTIVYNDETYIVTTIGAWAFDCAGVTSVVIPNSVTNISYSAFFGCSNMETIVIPSSVISIGSDAFVNCTKLNTVYITDIEAWCKIKFTSQESNPLKHAKGLYLNDELITDITIPNGITEIGDYVFCGYSNLKSVLINEDATSIGDYAFYGCTSLSDVNIAAGVKSIGINSFQGCSNLKNVHIGDNVTKIGNGAFASCEALESIVIPSKVSWIGNASFSRCTNLKSIYLGKGVTTIDSDAFKNCKSMADFYSFPEQIPTLYNNSAFWGSSFTSTTLHVPANLIESYQQHNVWSRFGAIVALTDEDTAVRTISAEDVNDEYYSLDGRQIGEQSKGLIIMKNHNGKTRKVIRK